MERNNKDTILKNIAVNVRRLRKEKGMSQHDLASSCDVSRTNIGYIENAKHEIKIGTLCTLANALDVEYTELIVTSDLPKAD